MSGRDEKTEDDNVVVVETEQYCGTPERYILVNKK